MLQLSVEPVGLFKIRDITASFKLICAFCHVRGLNRFPCVLQEDNAINRVFSSKGLLKKTSQIRHSKQRHGRIQKINPVIVFTITQLSAADRAWIFSKACNFIEYFWNKCSGSIINLFSCRRFPDDFIRGRHFSIEPGDLHG